MIELRNLFRLYATSEGDAAALQGLSLDVREGEVVVVLGPSGSGKTTLLRILAGLDRPSAGTARAFGLDLGRASRRDLVAHRASLGYADQHYGRALAPELSARELVALRARLLGVRRASALDRADELLDAVGLLGRADARPAELSGGEQQRISVCAAVAHRPRLVLADEPTGELDSANAVHIYELLGRLVRNEGCTTVLVSHDRESTSIADRVVHIRDGRVSEEAGRAAGGGASIVVGRGGWLRLPEELLRAIGIDGRATARLEDDAIVVRSSAPAVADTADTRVPPEPEPVPRTPRAAAGTAVELRALGRSFGGSIVFRKLDATLPSGQFAVVTGPSGSGKTTLLHILAGLDLPSEGSALVLGTDVAALDRSARAAFRRKRLALVRQEPGLVPFLSARENILASVVIRESSRAEAGRRADDALQRVGLSELADQRVDRLSAGERQRVAIARAVAARPALLLADEPTARLDEENARSIGALLATLADEVGTTVVVATHDGVLISQADTQLELGVASADSPPRREAALTPCRARG